MNKAKISKTTKSEQASMLHTVTADDVQAPHVKKKMDGASFTTWVHALMQNWRQGTVACKGRSDVSFSTKKPWKQKGTGRARAGSARSPLWRSGGVTFGPQRRTKTLKVLKKVKKNILQNILFAFLENDKVVWVDWAIDSDRPKTAPAYALLKNIGLQGKKVALFVDKDDVLTYASFANIPNVSIFFFDQANAFDLANSDCWLFLKKDLDHFKHMVGQWN